MIERIKAELQRRTGHCFITITSRGDAAIKAALNSLPKGKTLLIPEEGGWISYQKLPEEKKIPFEKVHCHDAKVDLLDLQQKLSEHACSAFLYQNPGGYFAEQPMENIYELCKKHGCLVILDVSGAIGTSLCDGNFADILVCSFGKWKLVEAGKGGFISCKDKKIYNSLSVTEFTDTETIAAIKKNFDVLEQKIKYFSENRKKIINELGVLGLPEKAIIYPNDCGFVIVVAFSAIEEKEKIINYCCHADLGWTECPRYIRVLRPAISIELKRLKNNIF